MQFNAFLKKISEKSATAASGLPIKGLGGSLTSRALTETLDQFGCILFPNYGDFNENDCANIEAALGASNVSYVGGNSPRTQKSESIYTSTEYPAQWEISLHHEVAYLPQPPRYLVFHCAHPASKLGGTTVADSRECFKKLPDEIKSAFLNHDLIYSQTFTDTLGFGKSWQSVFETDSLDRVKSFCRSMGALFETLRPGVFKVSYKAPSVIRCPTSGEIVWINQAHQWHSSSLPSAARRFLEGRVPETEWPHGVTFGNGQPIPNDWVATIIDQYRSIQQVIHWQDGMLAIVNNLTFAHGRESFEGKRDVRVAIFQ